MPQLIAIRLSVLCTFIERILNDGSSYSAQCHLDPGHFTLLLRCRPNIAFSSSAILFVSHLRLGRYWEGGEKKQDGEAPSYTHHGGRGWEVMEVGGAHMKVGGAYAVTCSREGLALGIVVWRWNCLRCGGPCWAVQPLLWARPYS